MAVGHKELSGIFPARISSRSGSRGHVSDIGHLERDVVMLGWTQREAEIQLSIRGRVQRQGDLDVLAGSRRGTLAIGAAWRVDGVVVVGAVGSVDIRPQQ